MNAANEPAGGVRAGDEAPSAPVIAVTRGRATDAELAAVTTVLLAVARSAAAAAAAAGTARRPWPSPWAGGSRVRPAPPRPGPHAWRASALPR